MKLGGVRDAVPKRRGKSQRPVLGVQTAVLDAAAPPESVSNFRSVSFRMFDRNVCRIGGGVGVAFPRDAHTVLRSGAGLDAFLIQRPAPLA